MKVIKNISERLYYFFDNIKPERLQVTIDNFKLNKVKNEILVLYRLGRQKAICSLPILQFENEYFDQVSSYDKHRLTKFSTLQYVLDKHFNKGSCSKVSFINQLEKDLSHEQLF